MEVAGVTVDPERAWDAELGTLRIAFGDGRLAELGELVRGVGGTRVLVVTDRGIAAAGHLERARRSLESSGLSVHVFDGVEENPTTRHVARGVESARGCEADCLVGLGGGSSMDCAKGINFLVTNGGRMEDYRGRGKATRPMLPSIGVPTTAGTGSEAQSYALISQPDTHVKMACGDPKARFRAVLLDPSLVETVPRDVTAATGMDAVAHAVESYVTRCRNPLSMMFAAEAWRLLEGNFEALLDGSADLEARGRMLLGAHLSGHAIEQSMLGAAHACANPLTARFGVTHGIAVSLMLPHVMRFNASRIGSLYDRLRSSDALPAWERVERMRAAAGLPGSLRDCGVERESLERLADEAAGQWTAGFNPVPVSKPELRELYEAAY